MDPTYERIAERSNGLYCDTSVREEGRQSRYEKYTNATKRFCFGGSP